MRTSCAALPAFLLLLMTGCGVPQQPDTVSPTPQAATLETAAPSVTPAATETPALSLHWIAAQNSAGRYQREPVYGQNGYGDGGVVARYLDFSQATEQIVGEPLEVENANVSLYADEEALYWIWSGMVTDTPVLLRSNLDGSNRVPLYEFPQGTAVAVWDNGLASDGTALYFRYCHISQEPQIPDAYELVRLDPETQTLETLTEWDTFSGDLVGVWDGQLLITRTTLGEDCPSEPVYSHYHVDNLEELSPWLTTSLCAFDPVTGQETVLYSCQGSWLDRRLEQGALWTLDAQNRLLCRPLGETEDRVVTQLPGPMQIWGVYTDDILLYGQEDDREWLYLYQRAEDTLTRSPQRRWFGEEDRAIIVVGQAGPGQYLVIDDASTGMQQLARSDGTQYLIDGYARYAIASRDALLDSDLSLTPVTRPGTPQTIS